MCFASSLFHARAVIGKEDEDKRESSDGLEKDMFFTSRASCKKPLVYYNVLNTV